MSVYTKVIIATLFLLAMTAFAQYAYPMQGAAPAPAQTPTSQMYTIMTANNSTLGTYLTDSKGMALYHFVSDGGKNVSTCDTSPCSGIWPPFYTATLNVPANLNPKDFGTITANGHQLTTFKGWPLYYYSKDTAPGQVNGQGILGTWSVVDPMSSNTFPASFQYK